MSKLTRRGAITATVAAGLALAGTPGLASGDEPGKVQTADQVLRDKVAGSVRVELAVEGWVQYEGLSAGPDEHQTLVLKGAVPGADRLDVLVGPKVFARLRALGIADPRGHFAGKTVVVVGKVNRNPTPMGGTSIIMWVNDLAQIESIAKK